ncbi:MAG: ABC transporter substrate-binding protein [Actinomycetota bacterium]
MSPFLRLRVTLRLVVCTLAVVAFASACSSGSATSSTNAGEATSADAAADTAESGGADGGDLGTALSDDDEGGGNDADSDDDGDGADADESSASQPESSPSPSSTPTPEPEPTSTPEPVGPRIVEHAFGVTEVPANPQRVVALGEEFLLADLLALGVKPIASSSNNAERFPGIDPELTEGIEVLETISLNLEYVASLQPDLLVMYPGLLDFVDYEVVAGIAPAVVIGEKGSDWREQIQATAEAFGTSEEFAEFEAQVEDRLATAAETLDGLSLSIMAVLPGPFIRMYTSDQHRLVAMAVEAGAEIIPSDVDGTDAVGRIAITEEQLTLLDGEVILMLQTSQGLEGEDDALETVRNSSIWATLPAAQSDTVVVLDRLGYPGASGLIRFVDDLAAAVASVRS